MADEKKRLSVAEMLAAARKADADRKSAEGAGESAAESKPAAEAGPSEVAVPEAEVVAESPPISKPAAAKPKPATSAKSGGGRLSVAEMMAAARADKERLAAGEAPAAAAKPATATPAAKPAAAKPAAAKAAAATPKPAAAEKAAEKVAAKPASKALAEPLPSASILAAARGEKPGPMTKAEAAARPPAARAPATAAKAKLAVPPMPPKPAYAVPKPKTAATEERRGVLALLVGSFLGLGFTALSVTGGVWSLLTARFMFPNVLNEPPSKFPVGPPDSISAGQVETKYKSQHVWIVNYEYKGKKEIFALRTVCTHLGCTPNWLEGEQKFKCPCHGSGYYKDGVNFEGPAPRPLERYAIHIGDDGQLEVDTSKTFHEELGQWTDPNSFVPV